MGCPHRQNHDGFTLVEISIVMIIIGLLIGGTFGGMKLIENMQVNKTVQDLKAIESAALTFKDTYGRLPGDMFNTAARLPNCTVAPCATGGNGNRSIDNTVGWNENILPTMEKFTFWHHLQAADLLTLGVNNTTNLDFGEGQPSAPVSAGYRLSRHDSIIAWGCSTVAGALMTLTNVSAGNIQTDPSALSVDCRVTSSIDGKIDDGTPLGGRFVSSNCGACGATAYTVSGQTIVWYDLKGF